MWLMQTVISSIVAAGVVSVSACRSDSAATERVTVFSESMPAFSDVAFSRTSANMARRPNRPLSRRAIAAMTVSSGMATKASRRCLRDTGSPGERIGCFLMRTAQWRGVADGARYGINSAKSPHLRAYTRLPFRKRHQEHAVIVRYRRAIRL